MRILPTRIHGLMDYAVGLLLIAAPFLFGFADGGAAQWTPLALGLATIGYSLFTRYEWGVLGVIPMPLHLTLDFLNGALLAVSPWLFGFANQVFWPHLALGLVEVAVVAISQTMPRTGALIGVSPR